MESPLLIALSQQMVLRRQMDVVANNMANANTSGFKQQRMLFTEFLERPAVNERLSFVQDRAASRDLSQGPLSATTNPLDVAINGSGYFVVDTVNGPRYTRDGHFQLDGQRQIVNSGGLPLLSTNNQPIAIPAGASNIRISADGNVFTELDPANPVGRIRLASFQREQQMTAVGANLYATDETPQTAPATSSLQQGMVEESNVKPVLEISAMIEVSRQYAAAQKVIDTETQRQTSAIQRLGKTT